MLRGFSIAIAIVCCLEGVCLAAVGDTVSDCGSISASSTADVQPGAAAEWRIHGLEFDGYVVLQMFKSSGSVTVEFVQYIGPGWKQVVFDITNGIFLRLRNPSATTALGYCYHGTVTK